MPIDHLPRVVRRPVERIRDGLLTDATALVILGLGCIARGISYIDYSNGGSHPAENWVSMTAWSIVWIAVGGLCLLTAPWHRSWLAAISVACGVSIHLLWALSFIWATYTGEMTRGWVSSIGYLMIVALVTWAVWRGVRTEIRVREVQIDGRDDHRGVH